MVVNGHHPDEDGLTFVAMLEHEARTATIAAWHSGEMTDDALVSALVDYFADTRGTLVRLGELEADVTAILARAVHSLNKEAWLKPPSPTEITSATRRVLMIQFPLFKAEVGAQQLIVKQWDSGEMSAVDLTTSLSPELLSMISSVDLSHSAEGYLNFIIAELNARLAAGNKPFGSIVIFFSWALGRLSARCYDLEHAVPRMPIVRSVSPPSSFGPLWRDVVRSDVPNVLYEPYVRPFDEKPEQEPPDVSLTMPEFADIIEVLPQSHRDIVRLLTLRVIGGWSLREIAKRDGVPLDQVAEQWVAARTWLEKQSSHAVGHIVAFDLFDLQLLEALLRDQRLASAVDWRTFERLLASIVEALGCEIELQQGTKDGGIDVLALKRDAIFGPHRYLLQAKRWSARVGIEPVRELLFLREHYRATKACLATTSTFTAGAWQLAGEYRWQLELRDYQRLADWVELLKTASVQPPNSR